MKPLLPILVLVLGLTPSMSFAQGQAGGVVPQPADNTYVFNQNGRAKEYTLSVSEIGTSDVQGRLMVSKNGVPGTKAGVLDMAAQPADPKFLVFYPKGREGVASERRLLRNRYLVKLRPGANLQDLAKRRGILSAQMKFAHANLAVCEEASATRALEQLAVLANDGAVVSVEPLLAKERFKRATPNDPLFIDQWHLDNTGQNGGVPDIDIKAEQAWDLATGAGVTVSVVDDGVYIFHEDLGNLNNALGHSWNGIDENIPWPTTTFDDHGTAVAGVIGATWNNDLGGSGVAPECTLVGLQLIAGPVDDLEESEAIGWRINDIDISNNSWGPTDFITDLEDPGPLTLAAFEDGVMNGRNGLGVIYLWAGGNGAESNDNSNYDGYANSPYTIAVGANTDEGFRSPYSEKGANLVVSAPSSGGNQDITTTAFEVNPEPPEDPTEDPYLSTYTDEFGGTSSATPAVAGVVALMLEANPQLGWRDVQEILMTTAVELDSQSGGWYTNAAGLSFNHDYGAGMVDAEAAVIAAQGWTNLEPAVQQESLIIPTEFMPDGDGNSYVATFDFSQFPNLRVEHVELVSTIIHQRRADLEITLISPNGTQSVLAEAHTNSDEQSISGWSFMTVRNWGEGTAGVWVVRVTDSTPGDQGFFNSAILRLHGVTDPNAPITQAPLLISNQLVPGTQFTPLDYRLEAVGADTITVGTLPAGLTYDPVTMMITGTPSEAGVTSTPVTLTGSGGTTTVDVVFSIAPLEFSLGEAVEQDSRLTTTGGDAGWLFELADTSDGVDALGSALDLGDNLSSAFGFRQVPEGVVLFNWKTDSEAGADRLWFSIGRDLPPHHWSAFISGDTDWGRVAVPMMETVNDMWWTYRKDADISIGRDRGFVDQVEFVDMQTFLDDVKSAGGFNFDFDMTSRTYWMPVADATRPDGSSIQSSRIGNGQTVSLATWVDGPAELSFAYKTNIGTGDALEVIVNSLVLESFTGNTDWSLAMLPQLPAGPNYVEIRYRRDATGGSGIDTVYLDNVSLLPVTSFDYFVEQNFSLAEQANPLVSGPDADPDGDGFSNLEEYAFGGDPRLADVPPNMPTLMTDGSTQWIEFGFDTKARDLSYQIQQSDDLENWGQSLLALPDRTEDNVDFFRIAIDALPNPAAAYFRVVATLDTSGGGLVLP